MPDPPDPLVDNMPPIPSLWPPPDVPAPEATYVLETIRFEGSLQKVFLKPITAYLSVMKSRGWRRLMLASEITGNPKQVIQIWQAPHPYPGTIMPDPPVPAEKERDALREYREFFESVALFERTLYAPMPYDPGAKRPPLTKNDTLMLVKAQVRDGAMPRLAYLKEKFFLPEVKKETNWNLHSAGYVVSTSRPGSTIVQAWHLPSANSLGEAMSKMGQDATYRKLIAPCIVEEEQELYSVISDDT